MADPVRKPAPEAISIQAAAIVLMVSEKTIRRKIKSGELEAVKFGKLWRIPKDVLLRLRRRRDDGDLTSAVTRYRDATADLAPAVQCVDPQDVDRLAAMLVH